MNNGVNIPPRGQSSPLGPSSPLGTNSTPGSKLKLLKIGLWLTKKKDVIGTFFKYFSTSRSDLTEKMGMVRVRSLVTRLAIWAMFWISRKISLPFSFL
jgi:hypothetical protein